MDRGGAGRRDIEYARIRERMLQSQARAALLGRGLVAALALAAGGVLHRVRLVEHDDAVETCPGDQLLPLKRDFDEINRVLAELVQPVQDEIGEISPWIGFLEKIDSKANDAIINFSMDRARASAWNFAVRLNALGEDERLAAVKARDQGVAELGQRVYKPGRVILPLGLLAIRLRESNDIARVINTLEW